MLQNEDQDSRQISRLRSRPKPRPLHLQSCSIHNNNKLSSIFQSQIHFKTLHPLACGSKTPHPLVLISTASLLIYNISDQVNGVQPLLNTFLLGVFLWSDVSLFVRFLKSKFLGLTETVWVIKFCHSYNIVHVEYQCSNDVNLPV